MQHRGLVHDGRLGVALRGRALVMHHGRRAIVVHHERWFLLKHGWLALVLDIAAHRLLALSTLLSLLLARESIPVGQALVIAREQLGAGASHIGSESELLAVEN